MPIFRGKRVTHKGYSSSLGADLGGSMAEGIQTLVHASKDPKRFEEDETGLIPSDHIVRALGASLEAKGYKRL
jgi:hypothetical protein